MAYDLTTVLGGGGGGIKSVQRGFSSMTNSETSATATITAVNLSKSFLVFSNTTRDSENSRAFVSGRIDTSTQLIFFRESTLNSLGISWEVVEFE